MRVVEKSSWKCVKLESFKFDNSFQISSSLNQISFSWNVLWLKELSDFMIFPTTLSNYTWVVYESFKVITYCYFIENPAH